MHIIDYACKVCNHVFEEVFKESETILTELPCEKCGNPAIKQWNVKHNCHRARVTNVDRELGSPLKGLGSRKRY